MSDAAPANEARIAQFRKMATDDPENDLAHLSLGRELMSAGRYEEAIESLRRTLELKEDSSKAYQLLGESLNKLGRSKDAAIVLKRGVQVAAGRGDRMPQEAMSGLLREMGEEVPQVAETRQVEVGEGQVLDARTGKLGARLPKPPFRTVLGRVIYENVSAESWREWIGMGTKVINELRLPLADPRAQEMYDEHLIDFLNLREKYEEAKKSQTPA
jgi:Fe-S cluster biosynthesis and repair protein YggX